MNWDSECRFGFALKNASPILGEDGLSWACDLMTGNYVHEGILTPYISHEWPLWKVEQSGPLVSKLSTSNSISMVLDLLSGDTFIYLGTRRVGPVMVNLRRCMEQRRLALKQVVMEEDELIFPAFCAKNATVHTRLNSDAFRSMLKNETRNFRNFPSLYASYKKRFTGELIFHQPCGTFCTFCLILFLDSLFSMNKDCLQNICQYLPYPTKFDLRNTCRGALGILSVQLCLILKGCFMKWNGDEPLQSRIWSPSRIPMIFLPTRGSKSTLNSPRHYKSNCMLLLI